MDAQRILRALGYSLPKSTKPDGSLDGLYGPETRGKWGAAAEAKSQDPTFERVGPTIANVRSRAWDYLRGLAAQRGTVVGTRGGGLYIP